MKLQLTVIVALLVFGLVFTVPVRAQSVTPLTPSDLRGAYNVNPLLNAGYTGKGVTVAIVNTGVDGTFNSDIKMFDGKYGLPDATVSIVRPNGAAGTDQELPQAETTADAELIHAMAPDAKILLVLVGGQATVLPSGFSYVIDNNAADIAMESPSSWKSGSGAASWAQSYSAEYAKSVAQKITLIAASNDFGSNNTYPDDFYTGSGFWTTLPAPVYMMPQYSPYVTAVGGTVLTVAAGSYSEVGWSQSGGGPSTLFTEPSWQTGPGVPQNGFRNIPDIALDASCDTPYAIDWNNDKYTWFCGTSGAAPTFAGILADIQQAAGGRLGFLNPTLYSLAVMDPAVYHDITSGCSILQPNPNDPSSKQNGYCAQPGWDFVTGWGSVDASRLASHLAPSANIPEFSVGVPILFWLILVPVLIATRKRAKMKLT